MKQHEREFFVSSIRTGIHHIKEDGVRLKILTPTIDQEYDLNEIYQEAYSAALEDGILKQSEIHAWMLERGIWTEEDEQKVERATKDADNFKIQMYESRHQDDKREYLRKCLRAAEKFLANSNNEKGVYHTNTCEGLASIDRVLSYLKMCTFYKGQTEPYDFHGLKIETALSLYHNTILQESTIRELARTDPWRSTWTLNDAHASPLFSNTGRDLSINQKNLVVWSQMYDNIQESVECPTESVLSDDDLLDGWFILQRKKRVRESSETDFESSTNNEKIKNSSEVFLMAKNKKDIERINDMNGINGKMIKKDRNAQIKKEGSVSSEEFADEKLKIRQMSNESFKDKFRS